MATADDMAVLENYLESKKIVRGTSVTYYEVIKCDVCASRNIDKNAVVDGKTVMGAWSFMCKDHFRELGVGIGLGRGQVIIQSD